MGDCRGVADEADLASLRGDVQTRSQDGRDHHGVDAADEEEQGQEAEVTHTVRGDDLTISLRDGAQHKVVEMSQTSDVVTYSSCLAQRPDTMWRGVDAHGHEHRWMVDDEHWDIPTCVSREEHVPCDGSCGNWDCEGYDITVWECAVCGDRVEPRWVADTSVKSLPGPTRMSVRIVGSSQGETLTQSDFGRPAPFTLYRGHHVEMRGTAHLTQLRSESSRPFTAELDLVPARDGQS
jgi:hypothetical protein